MNSRYTYRSFIVIANLSIIAFFLLGSPSSFGFNKASIEKVRQISATKESGTFSSAEHDRMLNEMSRLKTENEKLRITKQVLTALVGFTMLIFFFWLVISRTRLRRQIQEEKDNLTKFKDDTLRNLDIYLGSLSHELRTPLNGITGGTELLKYTNLTDKQEEFINLLDVSSSNMLAAISDYVEISDVEKNGETTPVNLHHLTGDIIDMISDKATEQRIKLNLYTDTKIPPTLYLNQPALRKAITGFLRLAIYRPTATEVLLKCELIKQTGNIVSLKISFIDNGTAINPQRFKELLNNELPGEVSLLDLIDQNSEHKIRTLAKVVKGIDGALGLEPSADKGNIIWISLVANSEEPTGETTGIHLMKLPNLKGLIVDDNPNSRAIFRQYMQFYDMRPKEVETIDQALNILNDGTVNYPIVLLNLRYPTATSLTGILDFKKNNPQSKTRFILVSSTAMPLTYQEFKEYGVDAILSKPVKIHELYHIIEKLADKVPVRPTVSETIHLEKPVVLIVEDNIINEKVAKATLERLGYMVDVAENGKIAWQKYIEHRYELILMDVEMPEMDGIQTTIKIRDFENHSGNGKHPRIIAVTANVKPGDRELCLNAGMDDYISKPFKHEELIKVLTSNK